VSVRAPAAATIADVSVLTTDHAPGEAFELGLSPAGIEIRRPGRDPRRLTWERISEWEIEERAGDLVLTLRGDGSVTPLVITGWSFAELDEVMRAVTSPPTPAEPAAVGDEPKPAAEEVPLAAATPVAQPQDTEAPAPVATRRERRRNRRRRVGGKAVVTVGLLVLLAAAVTLVLLQSAGVIHWSFLGPIA
jgi:hypothetical protein